MNARRRATTLNISRDTKQTAAYREAKAFEARHSKRAKARGKFQWGYTKSGRTTWRRATLTNCGPSSGARVKRGGPGGMMENGRLSCVGGNEQAAPPNGPLTGSVQCPRLSLLASSITELVDCPPNCAHHFSNPKSTDSSIGRSTFLAVHRCARLSTPATLTRQHCVVSHQIITAS